MPVKPRKLRERDWRVYPSIVGKLLEEMQVQIEPPLRRPLIMKRKAADIFSNYFYVNFLQDPGWYIGFGTHFAALVCEESRRMLTNNVPCCPASSRRCPLLFSPTRSIWQKLCHSEWFGDSVPPFIPISRLKSSDCQAMITIAPWMSYTPSNTTGSVGNRR